jgi:ppGpp synthetase/RelA/SpoT-type nucleotidyltranferase
MMFGNEGLVIGRMKQRVKQLETIIKKLVLKEQLSQEEKEIIEKLSSPKQP